MWIIYVFGLFFIGSDNLVIVFREIQLIGPFGESTERSSFWVPRVAAPFLPNKVLQGRAAVLAGVTKIVVGLTILLVLFLR